MTLHEVEQVEVGKMYIMVRGRGYKPCIVFIAQNAGGVYWEAPGIGDSYYVDRSTEAQFFGPITLSSQTDGEGGDGNNPNR